MKTNLYPEEYILFFEKFNHGEYYECHDLLESIWLGDRENRYLQGMLQLAVGIYHYEYGNVKGARLMFQSALAYLQKYRPRYWGVDVDEVIVYLQRLMAFLPAEDQITLESAKQNPVPRIYLQLEDDSTIFPEK